MPPLHLRSSRREVRVIRGRAGETQGRPSEGLLAELDAALQPRFRPGSASPSPRGPLLPPPRPRPRGEPSADRPARIRGEEEVARRSRRRRPLPQRPARRSWSRTTSRCCSGATGSTTSPTARRRSSRTSTSSGRRASAGASPAGASTAGRGAEADGAWQPAFPGADLIPGRRRALPRFHLEPEDGSRAAADRERRDARLLGRRTGRLLPPRARTCTSPT